jgi:presenilin-like A22 family membrane protease
MLHFIMLNVQQTKNCFKYNYKMLITSILFYAMYQVFSIIRNILQNQLNSVCVSVNVEVIFGLHGTN